MTEQDKLSAIRDSLDAVCENRCTQAELARLESLLLNDERAQWYFLRQMQLHAALRWDQSNAEQYSALRQIRDRGDAPAHVRGMLDRPSEVLQSTTVSDATASRVKFSWWRCVALATAASVAIVVSSIPQRPNQLDQTQSSAVAQIAHAKDASWTFQPAQGEPANSADEDIVVNGPLRPGTLDLSQGVLRIDFADGASVTLEAPSVMTVVSGSRARLQHGRLTAKAPAGAAGFTLDSNSMKIVDQGTVFGVAVDKQGTGQVLVFDGQVEVTLAGQQPSHGGSTTRLLAEGVAARVDATRETIEEIDFHGEQFSQSWPITYGVLASTGVVKFVEPAPFINPSRYENDDRLIVFPERESIEIRNDITVSIAAAGTYVGPFEKQTAIVSAQRPIRSYLLQFNPVGRQLAPKRMVGSVTFDRPILGVICTNALLLETDKQLGSEEFERLTRGGRGIEEGDRLTLSHDRRTLTVDFTSIGASDQIRLLVEVDSSGEEDSRRETRMPVRNL